MKKTLTFIALAALAVVAVAAQAFPEVSAGIQSVLGAFGPETLAGVSMAGAAGVVVRDRAYVGTYPVNTQATTASVEIVHIPITFPAVAPVAGDTHALVKLIPGTRVYDYDLFLDDVDSNGAPTASFDLGELNATIDNMAVTYKAGITQAQSGGVVRHAAATEATDLRAIVAATANTERVIGLKWGVAPATYVPGKTGLLVLKLVG